MKHWGRIGVVGASALLAMGLAACGSPSSGASAANPSGSGHASTTGSSKARAILKYGPIPWPSQLKADKTDPKGYVLTSKAQIAKLPKAVAAAVRTALKTETQYVSTAWVGGMLSGAGTQAKNIPPAHVVAGRWVTTDAVAVLAHTFAGAAAGCSNITNLKTTSIGRSFDYDMRDLLCNGKDPSNGDGYLDNSWDAMKFTHVTAFSGPSKAHPTLPLVVVAPSPDAAGDIYVPFGARGDYSVVRSPGPDQSGPTHYGAVAVEGWSSLIVTPVAGEGWRIAAPVQWLFRSTAHRIAPDRKAGYSTGMWYTASGCQSAPTAAPKLPGTLPDPLTGTAYTKLAEQKLLICGPGVKAG